jgi:hypothetical protein
MRQQTELSIHLLLHRFDVKAHEKLIILLNSIQLIAEKKELRLAGCSIFSSRDRVICFSPNFQSEQHARYETSGLAELA